MKVSLLYFGPVRDRAGCTTEDADIDAGTTLHTLFVERFPDLLALPIAYARNGTYADARDVAQDGDEIAFLPPVGGG